MLTAPDLALDAARSVLSRTIGPAARHFEVASLPARADGLDAFEVAASDGTVRIEGTSPVAICRGAYQYLKDACHVQITWNGGTPKLPVRLPDYARRSVVGPNRWRHYFNICTFGYTTVWWDWARWQKEIDWMALHGINMPLAMAGQDKVWQQTFRQLGVPQASLDRWFCGPAFEPWHWMGNVNGHLGPLSASWLEGQAKLQKQILARERSLGMKPVVPGFSGFVPTDFTTFHPEVKLASPSAWEGFAPTTFVDVRSPMFVEIGKRFVENYRKEFGSDHFYLCDTFNEQNPQFPAATEMDDLAACGRSVIGALRAGDPQATWVMQGWLFVNSPDYWTVPRTEALMRDVPQGDMIVLDLDTPNSPSWKRLPPVRRMGWIYNTLHNFGGSTALYGDLQRLSDRAHEDLANLDHGAMLGMGLTPEGIEQNPVVYELMTDAMWTNDPIAVPSWMEGYVRSRYGSAPKEAIEAWRLLLDTVYRQDLLWYRATWRSRPMGQASKPPYDLAKIREAVRLLLACPQLRENAGYRQDLVDVTKTWLGGLADARVFSALLAKDLDMETAKAQRSRFFETLDAIDAIMATREEYRLSRWIGDARKWGRTSDEKDRMEANARTQITVWNRDTLFDYANKEWAGVTKDFFEGRWQAYFAGQDAGQPADLAEWERAWAKSTAPIQQSAAGDPYAVAQRLWNRFSGDSVAPVLPKGSERVLGIAVGKPVRTSGPALPNNPPELAVDGSVLAGTWGSDPILARGWAAGPTPQWLEVDLEAIPKVDRVAVFPPIDGRTYRYRVEVSTDGQAYATVVDGGGAGSLQGVSHPFPARDARYVRITMLPDAGGTTAKLVELRVFGA